MSRYIDKAEAIHILTVECIGKYPTSFALGICAAAKAIENMPTADVAEVRHGEWVFDFELDGFNFYNCSVCGRQENLLSKESTAEYFPYCHCGAKMDGGGEG